MRDRKQRAIEKSVTHADDGDLRLDGKSENVRCGAASVGSET
jgi:hypothetical protein